MTNTINLKRVRKQKRRAADEAAAAANRLSNGRSKAEKKLTRMETERAARAFDGHKRDEI